ncbi:MAG: hypothetical protein KDB26_14000 [Microthrixaceae bacterium]|nr:hypothetical protein [Microthrixaceae bacterium]
MTAEETFDAAFDKARWQFYVDELYPWERNLMGKADRIIRYPRKRGMSDQDWETLIRRKAAAIRNAVCRDLDERHDKLRRDFINDPQWESIDIAARLDEVVQQEARRLGCGVLSPTIRAALAPGRRV